MAPPSQDGKPVKSKSGRSKSFPFPVATTSPRGNEVVETSSLPLPPEARRNTSMERWSRDQPSSLPPKVKRIQDGKDQQSPPPPETRRNPSMVRRSTDQRSPPHPKVRGTRTLSPPCGRDRDKPPSTQSLDRLTHYLTARVKITRSLSMWSPTGFPTLFSKLPRVLFRGRGQLSSRQ